MGLFGFGKKGNEGGIMDAIRCDEKDFLIWKWRPTGQGANTTNKENAIRWGSSLRVRPGQAAIFLYGNTTGEYDIIKGPHDEVLKTDNLPVLANVVGAAYAGGTPFQAEVYFVNLAKNMEVSFTIPFFRIVPAEPEYKAYNIEISVDVTMTFEVSTVPNEIKYMLESWGTTDVTIEEFKSRLEKLLLQDVQHILVNAPKESGIFVMHYNQLIGELGQHIQAKMFNKVAHRFGVYATDVILSEIRYNQASESYQALERITEGQAHLFNLEREKNALLSFEIERSTMATDANIRNMSAARMADMQLDHQEDMLGRMREESQYAQHTQTDIAGRRGELAAEQAYIGAHTVDVQGDVMRTGFQNIGNMGTMDFGGGNGGFNPAGMMMGMGMASGMAGQMGQMMGNMGTAFNNQVSQASAPTPPPMPSQTPPSPPTPPTAPIVPYFVLVNNQQMGPCDMNMLGQLVASGQISAQTLAWTQGMAQWAAIGTIPALAVLFQAPTTPPQPQGGMTPPPAPGV